MFTYSIQAVSRAKDELNWLVWPELTESVWLWQDTIRVQARDFGKDPAEAIKQEIHRRYANKASQSYTRVACA